MKDNKIEFGGVNIQNAQNDIHCVELTGTSQKRCLDLIPKKGYFGTIPKKMLNTFNLPFAKDTQI